MGGVVAGRLSLRFTRPEDHAISVATFDAADAVADNNTTLTRDAARAAAGAAWAAGDAWDAAGDAAGDAERKWQIERLRWYLDGEQEPRGAPSEA